MKPYHLAARATAGSAICALAASMLLAGPAPARADEHMVLVDKIDVGGKGLGAFDISFVDPALDLYVLADRTNGSVDFFDASDDSFIGRVGGFKGVVLVGGKPDNSLSGPDGVVVVGHKEVWAGDGDSTVKVIDLDHFQITHTISSGGKFRVDEMAWDSRDHILAAANNADVPPFVTLFDTDTYKVIGKIVFDGKNGTPDATLTGIEQPQWSPETGLFYVSVPQIDPTNPAQGGVSVINPHSQKVERTFPAYNCAPAGLALGPHHQALLGCSAAFGTSPNIVAQSLVMDIRNGDVRANITQLGGNDEVWYDKGTRHYYLAARGTTSPTGTVTPVLGVVDALTNAFDGTIKTSTSAHSVAADRFSHHVFVPIGFVPPGSPSTVDPTNPCRTTGCIAVYAPSSLDDDDGGRQGGR